MSFLGSVLGAVLGGGLAIATGGLSLPVGAAIGGGLGGATGGGGIQGALQGATLGYTGGSLFGGGLAALGTGGATAGVAGADAGAVSVAQTLIQQGVAPAQAIQMAGISPAAAQAAGLTAGASMTWADLAAEQGLPFGAAAAGGAPGPGGGVTPPASMGGMLGQLGQGVSPMDIFNLTRAGMGGGVGAMPWGSPSNLMTMGSGIYGLMQSENLKRQAAMLASQADPFAQYRGGYGAQLQALTQNPSLLTQTPGYAAGLEAVQRSMAAQGYQGSGNMMAALQKYGGDIYNQQVQTLAGLAGANLNPAAAGQLALSGQMGGVDLASRSLGTLGYGAYMAGR